MSLDIPDLLDLLRKLPPGHYRWGTDDMGMIRAQLVVPHTIGWMPWDMQQFSPLTALAYELTGTCYELWQAWDQAAAALDIPLDLASAWVGAEDADSRHDPALRAQICVALGLAHGPKGHRKGATHD